MGIIKHRRIDTPTIILVFVKLIPCPLLIFFAFQLFVKSLLFYRGVNGCQGNCTLRPSLVIVFPYMLLTSSVSTGCHTPGAGASQERPLDGNSSTSSSNPRPGGTAGSSKCEGTCRDASLRRQKLEMKIWQKLTRGHAWFFIFCGGCYTLSFLHVLQMQLNLLQG